MPKHPYPHGAIVATDSTTGGSTRYGVWSVGVDAHGNYFAETAVLDAGTEPWQIKGYRESARTHIRRRLQDDRVIGPGYRLRLRYAVERDESAGVDIIRVSEI